MLPWVATNNDIKSMTTTKSRRSRGISRLMHHVHPSWSLAVLVLALAALVPCLGAAEDTSSVRHRRSLPGETPGKRITSNLVAELGKRPRELYSFGIGRFLCEGVLYFFKSKIHPFSAFLALSITSKRLF